MKSTLKQTVSVLTLSTMSIFGNIPEAEAAWWDNKDKPAQELASPDVKPGSPRIKGDLSTLKVHNNPKQNAGDILHGKYTLVYFGSPHELYLNPKDRAPRVDMSQLGKNGKTVEDIMKEYEREKQAYDQRIKEQGGISYDNNSCAIDLGLLQETKRILANKCDANIAEQIVPVFVFPQSDHPDTKNVRNYIDNEGSQIVGLTGSEEEVFALARQYKARFRMDEETGFISGHTRFTYLMDPEGNNLAIFPANSVTSTMAQQFLIEINKDNDQKQSCDLSF